jgi:hypothetical protein
MKPFNYKIQILFEPYFFFFLKTHAFQIEDLNSEAHDCNPLLRRSISDHACLPMPDA